jgi:hypothetical protein
LSKLRALLNEPNRARVLTAGQTVSSELHECRIDALDMRRGGDNLDSLPADQLRALAVANAGEFLEGLELASAQSLEVG